MKFKTKLYKYYGIPAKTSTTVPVFVGDEIRFCHQADITDYGNSTIEEFAFGIASIPDSKIAIRHFRLFKLPAGDIGYRW